MRDFYFRANGIEFHAVADGSQESPLVLLLHGIPEFWYSWRKQIPVLAEHFWVVAPDLRGYNLTQKPEKGYDLDTLTEDIAQICLELGKSTFTLVGHDWGGTIGWDFAYKHPEMLEKLVILNAAHPVRFAEELMKPTPQSIQSWYFYLFQLPFIPEFLMQLGGFSGVEALFKISEYPRGTFTANDISKFKDAASETGASKAMFNYYREILNPSKYYENLILRYQFKKILTPTMFIWGTHDFAMQTSLTSDMERFFDAPYRCELLNNAGHWVQQEAPQEVNQLLLDFLI